MCRWFPMVTQCNFPCPTMDADLMSIQNMEWACARSVSGSAVSTARYRSRARPGMAQGFWSRCQQKKEAVMASNNHHNNNVSILIVDDHEVVRNGIRSYLETLT